METWRDVVGYEGKYQVSDWARVRDVRGRVPKIKAQNAGNWGYFVTDIEGTPKLVHRLLAQTFIVNPKDKPEVNHINGDKLDNSLSNLEWVTSSDNTKHAIETGLNEYTRKKRKKVAQYDLEGRFVKEYPSINSVAKAFRKKGQHSNVRKVCEGKRKSFQGYVFKYV